VTAEREMAMPQVENGYTRIANELLEALAKIRIPGEARQVFDVIMRKTYGFQKKSDPIALTQFTIATGLSKVAVCKALRKLIELNVITKKGNEIALEYEINKHYGEWKPLPKKVTLPKKVINVTKKGNNPLPKMDTTKETITKEKRNYSLFSKSESEQKKPAAEKVNGWAIWVDINRERNRVDPIPAGPDTKAAKFLTDNIDGIQAVKDVMRLFLDDGDPFLQRNGHALRHITGRVNAYLNLADQMFGGGDADDISDILAIEEQIAKQEAEERERKQNGNIKGSASSG